MLCWLQSHPEIGVILFVSRTLFCSAVEKAVKFIIEIVKEVFHSTERNREVICGLTV